MKIAIIIVALFISGCAFTANPEIERSLSRDRTMDKIAKTALINEMLNSPDPHVRSKGASIAEQVLVEPKKNWFSF